MLLLSFGLSHGAVMLTSNTSVYPTNVYSGDSGYISIVLTNSGTSGADNIVVTVNGYSPEIIMGLTEWKASYLLNSNELTASFPFTVNSSAGKNTYYVDFNVVYLQAGGHEYNVRAYIEVEDELNIVYTLVSGNEIITGNNTINIDLMNPHGRNISNVLVKLVGNDPFSVLDSERFIDLLKAGETKSLSYDVWIDDVSEGIYPMILSREYAGSVKNITLNFRVHGKPDLTYEVINDYHLIGGGSGNVSFLIRNTGLVPADDVKVSLMGEDPISIKNPEQYFIKIDNNDSVTIIYAYSVSKDAEPGIYPLTLNLVYESNESHALQFEVIGQPDLEIAGVNTDPDKTFANTELSVSIQIENVGTGKARNVKAYLTVDDGIRGLTEFFIGPIEGDDIDSAIFDLIIGDLAEGPSNLLLNVTYSDLDGNDYSLTESIRIYIRRQADYTLISVIIVIALIIAVFYFRKRIIKSIKNLGKMI